MPPAAPANPPQVTPAFPPISATLDHLVVTAPALDTGVAYVRERLGVELTVGGEHARMGTHNALLRLGPATYLEVIAPNPRAPEPGRHRWFALGRFAPGAAARLSAWVVRTDDLDGVLARVPELGLAEPMSRGSLSWRISIPPDGSLPYDGMAPVVIQWNSDAHPAATLPDAGCSLARLEGTTPDIAALTSVLKAIGYRDDFHLTMGEPRLVAQIMTPSGLRTL